MRCQTGLLSQTGLTLVESQKVGASEDDGGGNVYNV